jgi:hypothetical protein
MIFGKDNPAEPYSCLPGIMSPTPDEADPSRVVDHASHDADTGVRKQ